MILPGDILFVHGEGPISRAIEDVEHNRYSHCAIFATPTRLLEANGFRKVGYQDPHVYAGHADLYRCDVLSMADRHAIVQTARRYIGDRYDYGLIAVEAIRYWFGWIIPWKEHGRLICSTYVADAYRQNGFDPCPGLENPTPADLSQSYLFRRVGAYTG